MADSLILEVADFEHDVLTGIYSEETGRPQPLRLPFLAEAGACSIELLRIAGGEPLRLRQSDIAPRGHAIEVRLNAEDPSRDFAPFPGTVSALRVPGGPGVRFESMLYAGYTVPPFYDSLLAKLVVHAETREAAITRLRPVLMTSGATIAGHFPLTLVTGAGALARNSIGLVLVGGMAIGTMFTLFVIPSIYMLIAKDHAKKAGAVAEK